MAAEADLKHNFYTPAFKHSVLEEYKRNTRGAGFEALAKRFKVKGGPGVIARWFDRWDGTVESLHPYHRGGRPPALSEAQAQEHIHDFVQQERKEGNTVTWIDVQRQVKEETKMDVPISTLRNYGHAAGVWMKRTREVTEYSGELVPFAPLQLAGI